MSKLLQTIIEINPSKIELTGIIKSKISNRKCSICKQEGHNKRYCDKATTSVSAPTICVEPAELVEKVEKVELYDKEVLREQYGIHKLYVTTRISTTKKTGIKVRLPSIPEDISENIIKQIINNKLNDKTSKWDCKKGDLQSQTEGIQECKCFTSDGPLSFTPSSTWDVIYFLDARNWLDDNLVLYRVSLTNTSEEWKNIPISKSQTFEDQANQGRRPRIGWEALYHHIKSHCDKVYEGTFEDIFIPLVA